MTSAQTEQKCKEKQQQLLRISCGAMTYQIDKEHQTLKKQNHCKSSGR